MRTALFLALLCAPVGAQAAPDVTGRWITEDKEGLIAVTRCGASVCGTIARVLVNKPDAPTTDINNPDPKLRSRPFVGLTIFSGFKPKRDHWADGRIYEPKSGRTYRSTLRLNPDGTLEVSGCWTFICQSQRWTRAK